MSVHNWPCYAVTVHVRTPSTSSCIWKELHIRQKRIPGQSKRSIVAGTMPAEVAESVWRTHPAATGWPWRDNKKRNVRQATRALAIHPNSRKRMDNAIIVKKETCMSPTELWVTCRSLVFPATTGGLHGSAAGLKGTTPATHAGLPPRTLRGAAVQACFCANRRKVEPAVARLARRRPAP